MTKRLGQTAFVELLPDSIAGDSTMRQAAEALDTALVPSVRGIPDLLLLSRLALADGADILPPLARLADAAGGLSPLPADVLDSLAWQLHVDGYEAAVTYEDKRRMVDRSLLLHRRKGTPWAVAEALRALGYADARIIEGFGAVLYNGEIAHDGSGSYVSGNRWALFDVEIDLGDNMGISAASIERLRVAIKAWKNVRSWLRALSWRSSITDDSIITDLPGTQEPWTVVPGLIDTRLWGHPLYNGEIRYDNAIVRRHDGTRLYDGAVPYYHLQADGYTHNAELDHVDMALGLVLTDAVQYQPRYNGDPRHDALTAYGPLDTPAIDSLHVDAAPDMRENIIVTESPEYAAHVAARDHVGCYYDGRITHGQQYSNQHNGESLHNGATGYAPRGQCDNLHNGESLFDGAARYAPWGRSAPRFVYASLSDCIHADLRLTPLTDAFALADNAHASLSLGDMPDAFALADHAQADLRLTPLTDAFALADNAHASLSLGDMPDVFALADHAQADLRLTPLADALALADSTHASLSLGDMPDTFALADHAQAELRLTPLTDAFALADNAHALLSLGDMPDAFDLADRTQITLRLRAHIDAFNFADFADIHIYQHTFYSGRAVFNGSRTYDVREMQ